MFPSVGALCITPICPHTLTNRPVLVSDSSVIQVLNLAATGDDYLTIDGQVGEAGLFAYCASKGAVTVMTKSAALAMGARGYRIRVNSVHPGYVHTPLTEKEAADFDLTSSEYFAKVGAQHPIGFIGEPIDIAYLDVYLASDESRWVTGAEFTADGGWTAQ